MTTIAYRDGIMAADSRLCVSDWIMPQVIRKIRRTENGLVVGIAGNAYLFDALIAHLQGDAEAPDFGDDSAALIVDVKTRAARKYAHRAAVSLDGPFFTIGSGSPPALGALYAGASAAEAVRIASLLDPYTGGDIHVEPLFGSDGP